MNTSIHAAIGPSKNISRLYSHNAIFLNFGISLIGPYCPDQGFVDAAAYQKSPSFRRKKTIKSLLRKTKLGSLVLFQITTVRLAKRALSLYCHDGEKADLIVFRDAATAYEHVVSGSTTPYVLVMHCDGTNGMMFSGSAFPKLKEGFGRNYIDKRFRKACEKAAGILFLSSSALENFKQAMPDIKCEFGTYHQGLEKPLCLCPMKKREGVFTFVAVGTVCARKNQIAAIEAFSSVTNKESRIIIVGDGEELEKCKTRAKELGLDDRVEFTGALKNVGDALSCADVFISASLDEGLPNAAVEAMSYGLPLILTDVGSCSELISNNGFLVDIETPNALSSAMDAISKMPFMEVRKMGKASLLKFEANYTVEKMCKEHANMYIKTIESYLK